MRSPIQRQRGDRAGCFPPLRHWHLRVWLGSWLFSGAPVAIFEVGARLSTSIFVQSFSFWWVPGHTKSTSSPGTVIKPHTCIQNGVKKEEKKRAIDLYVSVISLGTRWAFTLGWLRKRPCLWLDLSGSGCVTRGTWGNKTTGNCQCLRAQKAVCEQYNNGGVCVCVCVCRNHVARTGQQGDSRFEFWFRFGQMISKAPPQISDYMTLYIWTQWNNAEGYVKLIGRFPFDLSSWLYPF